jgi:signal transduction histidine kinase
MNENFVLVKISDTGSGIPDDIVQKIFDPFFTTKDMGQGTGMGLDLVMKIMKVHHRGDIKVDSKPGATTFTLCFPKNL